MYYDMQSDRLYDNESAMEGIFGKLKDKMGNSKGGIIKNTDPMNVAKLLVAELKNNNRVTISNSDEAKNLIKNAVKKYNDNPGAVNLKINKPSIIDGYPVLLVTAGDNEFYQLVYVAEVNGSEQIDPISVTSAVKILGDKVKSLSE